MSMAELTLSGVTKMFGDFTAVRDVSLTVQPDEVLCLLGPSGCGKTTTLRMIAGLEETTTGQVGFGGRDVTGDPARARDVAMAFQFYALYPDLTVGQNLAFPLKAEGLDTAQTAKRVDEIAGVLQLEAVLDRYPHQLSEGEKQRVAVGRCVIRTPNAFLFDEPLSRLDAALREEMRGSIRQLLATLDRPTVIVTHDQLEAMTMGDRIAVMRDGRIEQIGAPGDVFDRPANTFVAGFIGTPQMTLLEGVCEAMSDAEMTLRFGDKTLSLAADTFAQTPAVGDQITLGMRPRAVELAGAGEIALGEAEVQLTENMGAETLVHTTWQGQALRALVLGPGPAEGDVLPVSVSAEALTLFGSDGVRLARRNEGGQV